jgi:mono/diheme cytochrome c family protein
MRAIVAGAAIVLLVSSVASGVSGATQDNQAPVASGVGRKADAARGKMLYDKTLRCYACHGFDGQTGSPRLAPMPRSEESFIIYLRKPATPGMPAFADVPRQDLVDVYAYIKSLRADAPPAGSIPLLNDLIERATKR